jgi:hypothetical protein
MPDRLTDRLLLIVSATLVAISASGQTIRPASTIPSPNGKPSPYVEFNKGGSKPSTLKTVAERKTHAGPQSNTANAEKQARQPIKPRPR